MKKILFICNEGMSTSFVAKKISEFSKKQDVELIIEAFPESSLMNIYSQYDLIMLAPQLSYMHSKIMDRVNNELPVGKLNPVDFGRMNIENLYENILKELK